MTQTLRQQPGFVPTVEQIARLVRRLSRRDQIRLVQLVPELREAQVDSATELPWTQQQVNEAVAHFRELGPDWMDRRPMQDDDPFVADLTVAEFFDLIDEEQERLWEEVHQQADLKLGASRGRSHLTDELFAR